MFYERFTALCTSKKVSITPLTKKLGYSTGSLSAWKDGTIPNGQILSNIADYFNTSTDYLLGRIGDPAPVAELPRKLAPDEEILLHNYGSLTGQGKEFINQTVTVALNTYKKGYSSPDVEVSEQLI